MEQIRSKPDHRLRAVVKEVHPLPGVRAGSALVEWDERLLAVQDDAYEFVWITPPHEGRLAQTRVVACGERLGPMPKNEKPDFEAAAVYEGAIYILGSGSSPRRRRLARLVPQPHELALLDAGPILDAVADALGGMLVSPCHPNIEGALVQGEALTLFHRGTIVSPNVAVSLNASALTRDPAVITGVALFAAGAVDAVPLTLTDVARVPGGYVYLACAEATIDAVADGPVLGAAIGIVRDGAGRYTRLVEANGAPSLRKYEGIVLDPDLCDAFVITDPDDPERPAELCRVGFEGPW